MLPKVGGVAVARLVLTFAAIVIGSPSIARSLPTGERQLGQTILEPAYNDLTGALSYLLTPMHAPEHSNYHAVSPLYVVIYPTSVASVIGTVNCQHQPVDNCPDHGPALAGLAAAVQPDVYGDGVWGHDHLVDVPPAPHGDFNVAWEPIAVLFTNAGAAATHITTEDQLEEALDAGDAIEIPLPSATFQCAVVPETVYDRGTPVVP